MSRLLRQTCERIALHRMMRRRYHKRKEECSGKESLTGHQSHAPVYSCIHNYMYTYSFLPYSLPYPSFFPSFLSSFRPSFLPTYFFLPFLPPTFLPALLACLRPSFLPFFLLDPRPGDMYWVLYWI